MKIDKRNIRHWVYLCLFASNVVAARLVRPFLWRKGPKQVVLYGHKLNGNLLAIYRYLRARPGGIDVVFLTMDPGYHRELRESGEASVLAIGPASIRILALAGAVISDHGLHALQLLLGSEGLKFFDVWHGIPFKGFDAEDFRLQHRYDETWVASPSLAKLYIERYGFHASKVRATGYARTDCLIRRDEDIDVIKFRLGLDGSKAGKIVLFAPTWKQDVHHRSIFPFGVDEQDFLSALSALGGRVGATFVLRAHLNSAAVVDYNLERIVYLPHARYPDTEQILLASDILVCDWSSIAFDFLLLDRPTIFLDTEAPFAKGLSLDAGYRFGAIVSDMDGLLRRLERYLVDPDRYTREFSGKCAEVKARVYATCADGNAAARCVARLGEHLALSGPSR